MQKVNVKDLALFGGEPLFESAIHVNRPNAGNRDLFQSYLDSAWDTRWFTNDGPNTRELERRLQDYLQVKNCVLTSNGTLALALLVRALEIVGEVIVPSFTFISTPHVLHWAGIRPIFCDIDADSWNIDGEKCEKLITNQTTAIISTHVWGNPCDIRSLEELAERKGLYVIFDAAHAFGCTFEGTPIGRFGTAEVFSFHATKAFHTFEGGAITTSDDRLAQRLRKIRNFGFGDYDKVEMLGTNAKMSEIHSAMGLANLSSIDAIIAQSKACLNVYRDHLRDVPGVTLREPQGDETSNYHYVVAEVSTEKLGLTRDQLLRLLHAENILARRYFYPGCHRAEPYKTLFPDAGQQLANTKNVVKSVLVLPAGAAIPLQQVREICALLRFIADQVGLIKSQLELHELDTMAQ